MCGNGIRCVAEWLRGHDPAFAARDELRIDTLSGVKTLRRQGEGLWQVEMGRYSAMAAALPAAGMGEGPLVGVPLTAAGRDWTVTCISVGNPHCVVPVEEVDSLDLAAIGPDMELTIIMEEDAPSILPCFDEDDALISVKGAPLFISYNPAQVLKLAGKRYLTGPVIFYRTDGHSTIVSLTVEDIYRFQTYLESHSTTLMADGQKLTCICID